MRISLIVSTYNRPDALMLVLKSINCQTLQPNEVIIADDGSDDKTRNLISDYRKQTNLEIIHSFQEDLGFRAAESRNRAISRATSDYIVLIDGDTILHPEFIMDHSKNAQPNYFIQGSRVLLSKNKTEEVIKNKQIFFNFFSSGLNNRLNSIYSNFLAKLFSINKNYLKSIKTCNMSFFRKDFISVNGFNNEFEGWGREDSEFIVRLLNKGINRRTLKFQVIQFHLWHDESDRSSLLKNDQLLKKAVDESLEWCSFGINKFL
jgi:glycosyltransferase involved in cell wall biosynthesis